MSEARVSEVTRLTDTIGCWRSVLTRILEAGAGDGGTSSIVSESSGSLGGLTAGVGGGGMESSSASLEL